MPPSSRLSGFYNLPLNERLAQVAEWAGLTGDETAVLGAAGLDVARADHMIENVIGLYSLPLGIATNFIVNGRDVLVPMVIEEPSVVAGASLSARLARAGGGFRATTSEPQMIGQLQVLDVADPWAARFDLLAVREELLALADASDPLIVKLGGGARDLDVRILEQTPVGPMSVSYTHLTLPTIYSV